VRVHLELLDYDSSLLCLVVILPKVFSFGSYSFAYSFFLKKLEFVFIFPNDSLGWNPNCT